MSDLKPAVIITFDDDDEIDRVMFFQDHNDAVLVWASGGLNNATLTRVEVFAPGQLPAGMPPQQQVLPLEAADA